MPSIGPLATAKGVLPKRGSTIKSPLAVGQVCSDLPKSTGLASRLAKRPNAKQTEGSEPLRSSSALRHQQKNNVSALLSGNLVVRREPILPRLLKCQDSSGCSKPFKSPVPEGFRTSQSNALLKKKTLGINRNAFVPWGSKGGFFRAPKKSISPEPIVEDENKENLEEEKQEEDTPPPNPLVLWESEDDVGH